MSDAILQLNRDYTGLSPVNLMVRKDDKGNIVLTLEQIQQIVTAANNNSRHVVKCQKIGAL